MSITRRQLLRVLGGVAALSRLPLVGCGDNLAFTSPFSRTQRHALTAFANVIIPPDDLPGGAELGAVDYIERLLAAFETVPPAIFADGPYSGRTAFPDGSVPPNDFARFMELDRVNEAAWRLQVLGGTAPDGTQRPSLFEQIAKGLDDVIFRLGGDIDDLNAEQWADQFNAQDDDYKALLIELVAEGAFSAPEYGGNRDLAGWKLCNFEGDSQPAGYSGAALTDASPGDPVPIDSEVADILGIATTFLGGRVAS